MPNQFFWNVDMDFEIRDHLLQGAKQLQSPNSSEREEESDISLLVIHNISLPPGEYATGFIDQLFCNQLDSKAHPYFKKISELRVSAHLLISRTGSMTQYVPFNRKAWHAGDSVFLDRENCNDFSIGIELEGTDNEPFTEEQYQHLIKVTNVLLKRYPLINRSRIKGHSDIAPKRKTDPGPFFEWDTYLKELD